MEIVLKWVLILFAVYVSGYVLTLILMYNMAKGHFNTMLDVLDVKYEGTGGAYTYIEIFQISLLSWIGVGAFVVCAFICLISIIVGILGGSKKTPWWEKSITPKTCVKEEYVHFSQTRKYNNIRN